MTVRWRPDPVRRAASIVRHSPSRLERRYRRAPLGRAADVAPRRIEPHAEQQPPAHGRRTRPCARTRPDPLCGTVSSSVTSAAAIVIAAQSSEAEIMTAETTSGCSRA